MLHGNKLIAFTGAIQCSLKLFLVGRGCFNLILIFLSNDKIKKICKICKLKFIFKTLYLYVWYSMVNEILQILIIIQ